MLRKVVLATLLVSLISAGAQTQGDAGKDAHRPSCKSAYCRKIESFLKTHYCGESPFGNGPENGCEIRKPKTPRSGVKVLSDFDCTWSDGVSKCQQHAQPPSEIRAVLMGEMRKLGLPVEDDQHVYFTVWDSNSSAWTLAEAYYQHLAGADLSTCQLIATIDRNSKVRVLREVPFQKTDADVPTATIWTPIDLADVDDNGQTEVILEGDAYEDHWLEVIGVKDGQPHTIFSGLGYYL
jgi:hypothetical protein